MPRRNKKKHQAPGRNRSRRGLRESMPADEMAVLPSRSVRSERGVSVERVKCVSGKTGWARHVAERRLEEIAARPDQAGRRKPVRVYECPKCEHWHLTAQTVDEFHAQPVIRPGGL